MSEIPKHPLVAPEDRVPYRQKLAYGLAGPVDIWSVWILVSIAYPLFNMELKLAPTMIAFFLPKFFPITHARAAEIREQLEARRGKV